MEATLGQILLNEALPADMRDYQRVIDKKSSSALFTELAKKYPAEYASVVKKLGDIGRQTAYETGGFTFSLDALKRPAEATKLLDELRQELSTLYENRALTGKAQDDEVLKLVGKYQAKLPDAVMAAAAAAKNPLALQAVSGARGNKFNLNSLLGADLLYTDHRGRPLPIPVLKNYSEGLSPAEYFAGAFGARKGIQDLKSATADAGYLAKQLTQAAHRLLVSAVDDDRPVPPGTIRPIRGMPVDVNDIDSVGGLLAHPIGGYQRNEVITPMMLKELRDDGITEILVRSPAVGGPADGGVYARDVGERERGGISPIGDYVGIAGAQAVSAPITQGQISSKHTGGIAGAAGSGAISGFKGINALVQAPKIFPGGATHAQLDGSVRRIAEAPQGGFYIDVGGEEHYVPQNFPLKVQLGDEVEAGDMLSAGTPNPGEITRHKGIGEGRRYFMNTLRETLDASGTPANRRNIELLSRALINHVRLNDEIGDWNPDDIVPYQALEANWQPRLGFQRVPPKKAVGMYLEEPVLHYSLGDKIRPSMLKRFEQYGINEVSAHADPPPFAPEMVRGMTNVSHDMDWMSNMLGSYQKDSVLEAARLGHVSDESGTSFVPAMARRENFGITGKTKGWSNPPSPS